MAPITEATTMPPLAKPGTLSSADEVEWNRWDTVLLGFTMLLWLVVFAAGTIVSSAPYRAQLATFEGDAQQIMKNAGMVLLTYTLTNVALLCLLASMLGMLSAKAILGPDLEAKTSPPDQTSPTSSALLRGFFVYLTLIGGVLVLSERFAEPSQSEYVRLAGLISLISFIVNYRPAVCARLLERAAAVIDQRVQPQNGNGSARVPSGTTSADSVHVPSSAALNG